MTAPVDAYARWRKPGGRRSTLVMALVPDSLDPNTTPMLSLVGHLAGLAVCLEMRQELSAPQSLVPFWVPSLPDRWQRHLAPGQRFSVDLQRLDDETWTTDWVARLEDSDD